MTPEGGEDDITRFERPKFGDECYKLIAIEDEVIGAPILPDFIDEGLYLELMRIADDVRADKIWYDGCEIVERLSDQISFAVL